MIYFLYPETSNRHLEDIDRLYRENEGMVFVFRNKEAIQTQRPERYEAGEQDLKRRLGSKGLDDGSVEHVDQV